MSNIDDLIETLQFGDEWPAVDAAKELGRLRVRKAVPALITALHSQDVLQAWDALDMMTQVAFGCVGEGITAINALRCAAADALAQIGDEQVIPDLLTVFHTTDESEVRLCVARALTHFSTPEVVSTLDTYIQKVIVDAQSDDTGTRLHAITRLKHIQTEQVIPALIAALDDPSFVVRLETADALGTIGKQVADHKIQAEIIAALIDHLAVTPTLHSGLPMAREYIAKALEHIGTPVALEAVRPWRRTQREQEERT